MTDKNEITGATLSTKHLSGEAKKAYDEAWDRTFGPKSKERDASVWVLGEEATQVTENEVSNIRPQCCGCCGDEC